MASSKETKNCVWYLK